MSIYGTDLAYIQGELQVVANGDARLVDDAATVVQDICLRLATPYGSLFYDTAYGSYVYEYLKEEDSDAVRFALCDEIVRRVEDDPRVIAGSPAAEIAAWTVDTLTIELTFQLRELDSTFNLVLAVDKTTGEMQFNEYS